MVAVKKLLFLALSVSAAWLPHDFNAVLAGLRKIDADTRSLGDADRGFDGSVASVAPIAAGELMLQTDLNATVKVAELALPFSETAAQKIINYVINPLEPDNVDTLNALKANRDQIRAAGFSTTVQQQLVSLKAAVDELAVAIVNKSPPDKKSAAKAAFGKYQDGYVDAIAYFS